MEMSRAQLVEMIEDGMMRQFSILGVNLNDRLKAIEAGVTGVHTEMGILRGEVEKLDNKLDDAYVMAIKTKEQMDAGERRFIDFRDEYQKKHEALWHRMREEINEAKTGVEKQVLDLQGKYSALKEDVHIHQIECPDKTLDAAQEEWKKDIETSLLKSKDKNWRWGFGLIISGISVVIGVIVREIMRFLGL